MSLTVYLKRFKILKSKAERFITLEFRGDKKTSATILDQEELITVNQTFVWHITTPIDKGELLTISLLEKQRFVASRVVGKYRLGLQVVVEDGMIPITDSLVDDDNQAVPAYLEMDVYYKPIPLSGAKEFGDKTHAALDPPGKARLSAPAIPDAQAGPSREFTLDTNTMIQTPDYDTGLDDLQRNFANLERTLQNTDTMIDMEAYVEDDIPRSRKIKAAGKRLLRRGLSVSAEKIPVRERNTKRVSTFKSMRSFIGLGKNRFQDSSDEEQGLLEPLPGPSSEPDVIYSQISRSSISSDDLLLDAPSPVETPKTKKMRVAMDMAGPSALKAADFQICITVIEARQLAGLNMDPVVCVQIGDHRKYTSVKESTNCPYYNEYFVFDCHMPPIMLFDKIITLSVLHSRNFLRANKLLGNFKLDVATVWNQTDRQFYHKWALLTDPDDVTAGPKGYLKCDISVIGKGDQVKIPPKSEKDEDDIEANLLLPDGVTIERQRARFIIKIYKADGLPKMDTSLLANIKSAFTGESQDIIDPYVQVSFAGMTGKTSVQKNCSAPVWNEQIVFTEMFPPLCQRVKIQLRDNVAIHPSIIATHFIDLNTISHDGERGFLPTFGPAYIYMYGSTRECALLDQSSNLNKGMGEGVQYRARILISIRTEVIDNFETPSSEVEVEPIMPINEFTYVKHEEFFLFGSVFNVNMIDKKLTDKPITFELSIGNAGNSLDGPHSSMRRPQDLAVESLDELKADTGYWQSTTHDMKAQSNDRYYYYLPYWDTKQCMHVRSIWPDHRRRLYNSNMLSYILDILEDGITDAEMALKSNGNFENTALASLKSVMETVTIRCAKYIEYMKNGPPLGNTKLDREREKLCIYEIEQLANLARTLKAIITKHSVKDRLKTTYAYINRLRYICEDSQHAMPDIFIWMISNGKRVAYQRIQARDIIYSDRPDEIGRLCGKMQTLFLKWPGKKASAPSGWTVPAKVEIYLWLGLLQDKTHFIDGLPRGYSLSPELKNIERPRANPPGTIFYSERHKFQMRAYIYQARSLIGSDSSGLSDPFARVVIEDCSATTQVIDETLSPTWDELLVFDDVLLYSTIDEIKKNAPTICIEIFDQDKVGKSDFIGRALARPHVKSLYEKYEKPDFPPSLEWYNIYRGGESAGELLATFELLEVPLKEGTLELPELPEPRESNGKPPADVNKGPILPVPVGVRPTLSKYRIEVLFWGLRNLKRIHFLSVDKPRVDIECAGHIIYSSIIQNTKRNPNFANPVKYIDVELPDQDLYRPPLTIRVLDCRSFGRVTLVGTHTINSIHKYMYIPMSKREREIEERKKSLIQLQNVDLHNNRIIQDDIIMTTDDRECCPLIIPDYPYGTSYGSDATSPMRKKTPGYAKRQLNRKRKQSSASMPEDDDSNKDWWTKYFSSVENMIDEEKENKKERQGLLQPCQLTYIDETHSPRDEGNSPRNERIRRRQTVSPKSKMSPTIASISEIPYSTLAKIYPHELEAVPEYEEFKDWLHSFDLYRGKKTGDDTEDDSRVVGTFKGALKVYKWPLSKNIDDHNSIGFDPSNGFFQTVPSNEPIHVLIRVYIVKATDLHPMDFNGKADPYIVLHLGSRKISDKEHYQSKQLNPVFGRCFETEATFPQDSMLTVQVLDWDLLGKDDLIGETKIDLENRFYSRHRATCGLPTKYDEEGYNRWRDALKPTQILAKLCKDIKIDAPVYEYGRVRVGRTIFNMSMDDPELFTNPDTIQEQMALNVLRRWHEVPRLGTHLVVEHVETRPLYNPNKPGIEQGRIEMWVDMFPMDMPLPGQAVNIAPRKPKAYEMRVIIWNTDDVVLEDDAFFTGEKMSDIYVKGWLKGPDDCQSTDIHYRSLTGEGNFNWRFIYPFDYLEAEERIVISRKESMFSWDETECKIPARLELQVWDADHFSADDFLGALTLDLNRFPRGAKSSNLCSLDMLRNDGTVPMVNIFKQKRIKGWWPFYTKRDNEEMELTGKVEAEIHLLSREDAEKLPAGLGRSEPDPLDKPNRPDASFMWFLNPLKSIRYILWHNYKWTIIKAGMVIGFALMILLFVYAVPGYTVKKFLGA